MNGAYWHIATNHIPVILMPFSFALLLAGIVRKSDDLVKTAYAALVVVALFAVVAFRTGGPAAGVVRDLPGIQRADIHEHAEAADFALWESIITGVLAVVGLWFLSKGKGLRWPYLVLFCALFTSTVLGRTAHLGGLIRHPEIRAGAAAPTP